MTSLAKYEAAARALAECKSVDEVKGWADRAAATQAYARMAKDKGLEVDAAEIRIRAERRLGEMLRDQKATVGFAKSGPKQFGSLREPNSQVPDIPTLEESGIDKKLSSRAQKLAAVPGPTFETEITGWRERVEEEGVRVSARLEAAGAMELSPAPEDGEDPTYTEADQAAEHAADYESMAKIFDADDRLAAAMAEIRESRRIHAVTTSLYDAKSREVAVLTKEAARWMRKAKKSAACQACMTALEREF